MTGDQNGAPARLSLGVAKVSPRDLQSNLKGEREKVERRPSIVEERVEVLLHPAMIVLGAGVNGTGNNFGELRPSSLSGTVYRDLNNDGLISGGETGIAGATFRGEKIKIPIISGFRRSCYSKPVWKP